TTSEQDIPKNAVIIDLRGKHIYPSFIDLYSDFGMPEIKKQTPIHSFKENYIKGAYYWNPAIKSDFAAHQNFVFNKEKATEFRKNGIGILLTGIKDGIVRGSAALVSLADAPEHENIYIEKSASGFSFKKGSSPHYYPSSLMGSVALIRQSLYDAMWYKQQNEEVNVSLKGLNELLDLPIIFECSNKWDIFRAKKIAEEFRLNFIFKTAGDEYQRIQDLKNIHPKLIIPLEFPVPYDVSDPMDADIIPLSDLKHWEMAPANPALLEKNKIDFAFTLYGLNDKNALFSVLRKIHQYGASKEMILKAFTFNPASFINIQNKLGAIKENYFANFFITNKDIFEKDAIVIEHWINGKPSFFYDRDTDKLFGEYQLNLDTVKLNIIVKGNFDQPSIVIKKDTTTLKVTSKINYPYIQFTIQDSLMKCSFSGNFNLRDSTINGLMHNLKTSTTKNIVLFKVSPSTSKDEKQPSEPEKSKIDIGEIYYPFCAYGSSVKDTLNFFQNTIEKLKHRYNALLIKDATIWTNTKDSILNEYDVYIVDGKIVRIAPNIDVPKLAFAKIIDAKGMHLTPGIIDEHSHIAIEGGVNEWTQASSAEVRIGDVINPEDINIYRQLAGGVTTAQLLHGSANPIGGQCQVIKLKWGESAENMKYKTAKPSIKFALGENVKQGNSPPSDRFPQTRMGVEQVFNDYFHRAIQYQQEKSKFLNQPKIKGYGNAFRKDLELEALVEILENKRNITCHSYVQSEINMLIHLADSLGFKVNTFTHILEGYKVADKLKKHGATASTFSDWWAYKMEVMEAIPFNAALLTKMGVNTCINSDDAEMGRRLNQEAGKTIKYGGLSPVQALKLITLNPAKALGIDKEVGSIEVGKVGDVVLWTDNPLSINAKVKYTIIEGKIYYDDEENKKIEESIQKERTRIIEKLIKAKKENTPTQKYVHKPHKIYHCDDVE
ncbi:MAG: amidohydrolase family protein, partial [Bacteroidia bacterium]|nr:amidohydrolase family protein [Bacteroidia bacterium]